MPRYAEGTATEKSDLDLLVEFHTPAISLFILSEMKYRIEEELNIPVDLIHAPLPDDTILQINKQLLIY
ncbi:MAG: hypothetical protein GX766_10005 [Firmicutes bacterium]|nr:hypothetical protein [Bacillota bacterium]